MKLETRDHTTLVRYTEGDLAQFLKDVTNQYKSFSDNNIIIDMHEVGDLSVDDINLFQNLSEFHRNNNKSFVIAADVDFNTVSDDIVVVPTILEAHDMIEMDEIERDLGF